MSEINFLRNIDDEVFKEERSRSKYMGQQEYDNDTGCEIVLNTGSGHSLCRCVNDEKLTFEEAAAGFNRIPSKASSSRQSTSESDNGG